MILHTQQAHPLSLASASKPTLSFSHHLHFRVRFRAFTPFSEVPILPTCTSKPRRRRNWNNLVRCSSSSSSTSVTTTTPLPPDPDKQQQQQNKGQDLQTLFRRLWKVAAPYWSSDDKVQARLQLAAVFALTLATTGISVGFNFLGRDFYNSLANKDQEQFTRQLLYYLAGFATGIPVSILLHFLRYISARLCFSSSNDDEHILLEQHGIGKER